MKPLYKKLIIGAVVLFVVFIIYLLWSFATPDENGSVPQGGNNGLPLSSSTSQFPSPPPLGTSRTSLNTKEKKLSEHSVFDFWIAQTTHEAYYITDEGKIYIAKEGPDLEVSSQTIEALNAIQVSPTTQEILASFGDPRAPQWGVFDIIDKVWRPLPKEIVLATWGERDGELITTLKNQKQQIDLVRADLTKTPPTYKTILKNFNFKDVSFVLFSPDELFIQEHPSYFYESRVWKLNLKTLSFTLFLKPEKGRVIQWSPNRRTAFQFVPPGQFSVLDGTTLALTAPLPFATFPDKCGGGDSVFSVYCFAPQEFDFTSSRFVLPDDYFKHRFFTNDTLYAIDSSSGDSELIPLSSSVDGVHPKGSQNAVYFINRYDGMLYRVEREKKS